jgi:predicted dehydrogenase
VHDTDFVNYCLGLPEAVFSQGYKGPSGGFDHIATHYIYNQSDLSPLVSSEGSWTMQEGYGFNMSYTANFENGTLSYLLEQDETLKLFRSGSEPELINLKEGMGYEFEIRTFVDEILSGNSTNLDLLRQASETVAIIEAEKTSIETCSLVSIKI